MQGKYCDSWNVEEWKIAEAAVAQAQREKRLEAARAATATGMLRFDPLGHSAHSD